jgi:hypothetical protein
MLREWLLRRGPNLLPGTADMLQPRNRVLR